MLALRAPYPSFYHLPQWIRAVHENLAGPIRVCVFREGGEVIGAMPVETVARNGIHPPEVRLPHHTEIFLGDLLIDQDFLERDWAHNCHRVLQHFSGVRATVLRFHNVPQQSAAFAALNKHPRALTTAKGQRAFCATLDPRSLTNLSTKFLRNTSRLKRRCETERGKIEHHSYQSEAAAEKGYKLFLDIEDSGWKGAKGVGTSIRLDPPRYQFYMRVLKDFGDLCSARVDVLRVDGQPAAALIAVRSGRAWHLLKVAHNEDFGRYGPGNILLKDFLEACCEDPETDEVSLVTAPPWSDRWHMRREPTYDIALCSTSFWGRVHSGLIRARKTIRRVREAGSG